MRVLAARLPDVAVPVYVAVLAVLGATAAWRAPETAFAALPTHVSPPEPMITPLTEGLPGY